MEIHNDYVKVKVEFDIEKDRIAEWLIADDPELSPMVYCGLDVQNELVAAIGWTEEIEKQIRRNSRRYQKHMGGDRYEVFTKFVSDWVAERLREVSGNGK